MAGRVVLLGATGYTGRLVAEALLRRGVAPLLAGRSRDRLSTLGEELARSRDDVGGELAVAVADSTSARDLRRLVEPGDVLVSTVGPFLRVGLPPARAAAQTGARYLDSTGEPPFVRRLVEELDPVARRRGAALVPAFGYDYVPGNLAGALALCQAGGAATGVRIGYFVAGATGPRALSGGTTASMAGVAVHPGYAWRRGRLVRERSAARVHSFDVAGRSRAAVSVAGSEHLFLPRLQPQLRDVDVYLGWSGRISRTVQLGSAATSVAGRIPGAHRLLGAVLGRLVGRFRGGPDAEQRADVRTVALAEALDPEGAVLARVRLDGPGPYDLTGELLAWAAVTAAAGGIAGSGVLGPVEAFGLKGLEAACTDLGLRRT
jgi:short subunit dehydrogenase-like uncharacterized protein